MSLDELTKKYQSQLTGDPVKALRVDRINFKPHPFTIGPQHVADAANNHGGMLGEETLRAIPCAAPHCHLSLEEHTFDTVLFLQLTRNAASAEIQQVLAAIVLAIEADKIDGFVFVGNTRALPYRGNTRALPCFCGNTRALP